jgi:hypothetical protein
MRLRTVVAASAIVALASGCGGDDGRPAQSEGAAGAGHVNEATVGDCLTRRGYGLHPSATGVSAQTPGGVDFTITFFPTPDGARSAAAKAGGQAVAVGKGVVTPAGQGRLSGTESATVEECLGG